MTDEKQPEASFSVEKLYIKDFSFEAPNTPSVFLEQEQPQIDIKMDIEHNSLGEAGMYEVVLPLSVTARTKDKTYFLAEVHQAGVFHIRGIADEDMPLVLEMDPLIPDPGQIRVHTRNYVVTLDGLVATQAEKDRAEQDARCLFAVDNVINQLAVGR